jgi:protein phosphatase
MGAEQDPDATGPIGTVASVRMTAEMPRVPLPGIPEDVPARAEYVQETDPDAAQTADERSLLGPPERRRSRRRRGAWALAIGLVVLGVAAVIGSFFWVRSQYYVGEDAGAVVVFRGVDGAVLGLQLSSVQEGSCEPGLNGCQPLLISDLVPAARNQVVNGITAGTLDDARGVIARLSGQMLPACPPAGATTSPQTSPQILPTSSATIGSLTSTAVGTVPGTAGLTPVPPTSPGATAGELPPVGTALSTPGSTAPAASALENTIGSLASPGSAVASGTPLSSRAPEPGVTCRVVR